MESTMGLFRVPDKVHRLWNEWNLRGAVLLSLFLQVLLIFSAPLRKRTKNGWITSVIWLAYLLADWVAVFAIGLISSNIAGQGGGLGHYENLEVNKDLAVYWAPFLLLHLGGPDTITAFSLEDNELWLRHLLGFVFQLIAVAYVITQSVPNKLWIPTVLMFFAGAIKYAERTRALFLACLGNFENNDSVPKIVSRDEHLGDLDVVRYGNMFFKCFRGVIIDRVSGSIDSAHSSVFLLEGRTWEDAFRIMEVELNFMYDVMFTKMAVVKKKMGYIFRFVCCVFIAVSFQKFVAFYHKVLIHGGGRRRGGIDVIDIDITLTLLIGAVGLELVSFLMLIFSDWTQVSSLLDKKNAITQQAKSIIFFMHKRIIRIYLINKRWCEYVSQLNFTSYSQAEQTSWLHKATGICGLGDLFDEKQYTTTVPVKTNLKKFIFSELKNKVMRVVEEGHKTCKEIISAKGNWTLKGYSSSLGHHHYSSIVQTVSEQVEYDESILVWHIATHLCYIKHRENDDSHNRENCKILSDYMLYLLVMQPTLLGNVPQLRFRETCEHAKNYNLLQNYDNYFSDARYRIIEIEEEELEEKELREKLEKELREKELGEKLEKELREKLEKELGEKLEKELREKLEKELREKEVGVVSSSSVARDSRSKEIQFKKEVLKNETELEATRPGGNNSVLPKALNLADDFSHARDSRSVIFSEEKERKKKELKEIIKLEDEKLELAARPDRSKDKKELKNSVLPKALKLAAHLLRVKDKKTRWEMMGKVWVELMCFGAGHSIGRTHAQQLSNGGELITFVWLLMAHFGLGEQFQTAFFRLRPREDEYA